jgi:hypothetical protein
LALRIESKTVGGRTARVERIIAGFEEVQRFVGEHKRIPQPIERVLGASALFVGSKKHN